MENKEHQKALSLGVGCHKALELFYLKGYDPVDVFDQWCDFELECIKEKSNQYQQEDTEKVDEQRSLGKDMMSYYKEWANKNDNDWFEDVVSMEEKFEVPIYTPKGNKSRCDFVGRVDGLVRDDLGRLWILENKTYTRANTDHLPLDEQVASYCYAISQKYNEKVSGVLYNIILKKTPEKPSVNKSGSISRRKKKSLTRELYVDTIKSNGEDVEDYQDILSWIDENSHDFVVREKVRKNDAELKNIHDRIYNVYRDISESKNRLFPNPQQKFGSICGDCSFKNVCIRESEGGDWEVMLDRMFQKRKPHEKEKEFNYEE